MLSNVEFAHANRVPVELSPEMAEFALFSLDMGAIVDEQTKQLAYPSLAGRLLFEVKRVSKANRALLRKKDKAKRKASKAENLAKYVERGFAFDSRAKDIPNEVEDKNPQCEGDEWDKFFNS